MLQIVVLVTTLAALGASGQSSTQCSNPLFQAYTVHGMEKQIDGSFVPSTITISVASNTPALFPGDQSSVCNGFIGQQSCCTTDTLLAIAKANADTQSMLDYANTQINVMPSQFQQRLLQLENTCATLFGSGSTDCAAVKDYGATLMTALDKFLSDAFSCVAALNVYNAGMRCLACSTTWNSFVDTATKTVDINEGSCTTIVGTCAPINTDFVGMMELLVKIYEILLKGDPTWASSIAGVQGSMDFCGGTLANPGDCSDFICNKWIQGSLGAVPFGSGISPSFPPAGDYQNKYSVTGGYDAVAIGCNDSPAGAPGCFPSMNIKAGGGLNDVSLTNTISIPTIVGAVCAITIGVSALLFVAFQLRRRLLTNHSSLADGGATYPIHEPY